MGQVSMNAQVIQMGASANRRRPEGPDLTAPGTNWCGRATLMRKLVLTASLCLFFSFAPARAKAKLTAQEARWLAAAGPVLAYSQRLKLPMDIVIQPLAGPKDVPLAMGYDGKRCKLVLSMRGNPSAEAILDNVQEERRGLLIEAITAHEVAHCWRYVQGAWHALPAGFAETGEETADNAQDLAESKAVRENRREEGFSDLVALAWTAHRHPDDYALVYAWLVSVRGGQATAHTAHDTRAWVRLARSFRAFGDAATPFKDVEALWKQGLLADK